MARSVDLARNYSGFLAANPLDGRLTPVWRAAKHPGAALRQLAASGQAAPPGGNFDRFDLADQAIPAPSNHHGAVAFFASLPRAKA